MSTATASASTPPGERPAGRAAGTQRWTRLAFAHWEVCADRVAALLPAGLEVDEHDGRTFVGVVPFEMRDIRASWMPRPLALDFLETNLRCYVRANGEPGVFFISLEASSWLAVKVARLQWGLPYHHANMTLEESGGVVTATSQRRGSDAMVSLRYRIGEALGPRAPDTLEHFLLDRYLLFCEKRGQLVRGQVHHEPYPVHAAELLEMEESLSGAAAIDLQGPPSVIHYSPGVEVEVFAPTPIEP